MDVNAQPALVPVLCIYTYVEVGPQARYALRHRGSKMIEVEHSDEIVPAFCRAMELERRTWNMWRIGGRPSDVELVGYLPANFQMSF